MKCDSCNFRIAICQGAAIVRKVASEDSKCEECGSFSVTATWKENSPFPGDQMTHTGCILCDTWLRGTIHNFFSKQQNKLMTAAEAQEAQRIKDERKRLKEEKKAIKEAGMGEIDAAAQAVIANKKKAKAAKKAANAAGQLLTDQERMNMFMNKFK